MKYYAFVLYILISLLLASCDWFRGNSSYVSYDEVYPRQDYRYIEINERMAVLPTIIEYKDLGSYLVGTRLPSSEVKCGKYNVIKIENKRMYFFLDLETGKNTDFLSKGEFEKVLHRKGHDYDDVFDDSKFNKIWTYYSRFYDNYPDYKDCRINDK
jgi:hypothetical protein